MRNLAAKVARKVLDRRPTARFVEMSLSPEAALARRSAEPGPIEADFFRHTGRLAHKWVHYLPVYDRLFAPYRDRPITMLEIGVSEGGSLELWRRYFGPKASIHGVEIDPDYAGNCDAPTKIHIGSQADPAFLRAVVAEIGPPDIVLDDGSHMASHQRASFEALFPLMKTGGLYLIEDLQTAYWPHFEGGFRRPGTAVEMVKSLIDDQHGWYHGRPQQFAAREQIGGIFVYDSIVGIEKVDRPQPGHVTTEELKGCGR